MLKVPHDRNFLPFFFQLLLLASLSNFESIAKKEVAGTVDQALVSIAELVLSWAASVVFATPALLHSVVLNCKYQ